MDKQFDYNTLLNYINNLNGKKIDNLFTIVEDVTSLVLDLEYGYIYFTVEIINSKYNLTYRKFNSKLKPVSETRMSFEDYQTLVSKTHNVVIYNLNKKPRKK